MKLTEFSERLSDSLASELSYDEEKKEIMAYGLETVVLAVIGIAAVLIMGLLFKAFLPTLVAIVFGGSLRKVSGGAHLNTPVKCIALGAVVYSLLGVAAKELIKYDLYNIYVLFLGLGISLVVIILLAPVDSEAKPIHSLSFRRKLKAASIAFIGIGFAVLLFSHNPLVNTSAVLGIFYQSMTLLPVFNKN